MKLRIGRRLDRHNNTGPLDVVGNSVHGNLVCQHNSNLMMGGGNKAGGNIIGQCH